MGKEKEKENEESALDNLKVVYREIQKEYDLPDFDSLNRDFQIEKLAESETDFLVREIRKFVAEKMSNYLRFIETILNPVNVHMFVYSVIKSIGNEEKKVLTNVYKKLAKFEVDLIGLDISFSEEKEVKFIKSAFEVWQEIKKDILGVLDIVKKNWDNKIESNGKGYFG